MSYDEHCDHVWRLIDERTTGPAPGFDDEPFVDYHRWYCQRCRKFETTQEPDEATVAAKREAARAARMRPEPIKPATPTRQDGGFDDDPIAGVLFWCIVGVIVGICLIAIGTQVMPA